MRLVLDLQACQTTGSRFRGIGRYSLALAAALLRQAQHNECWVVLNGAFPDSVDAIKSDLRGLLPEERICVWNVPGPVSAGDASNIWRQRVGEALRETYIQSLKPDLVHVSSLFEGLGDDAVTSISGGVLSPPAAVTLYDLIPLINQEIYLANPAVKQWYLDKLESLRRARLLLAISESSRQEAIKYLDLPKERVVNISSAANPMFRPLTLLPVVADALRNKFGLLRPFVMYTGGIDHRKNIEGLIRAFAMLMPATRASHQLAIVCNVHNEDRLRLQRLAASVGLEPDELIMTGFVSDDELVALCNLCKLFVFPSWHEGFGLPALEAMACGAAVIASNSSSLPEVVGRADALFDPFNDEAIAAAMQRALVDEGFLQSLSHHGMARAKLFSWDETARRSLQAMEVEIEGRKVSAREKVTIRKPRLAYISPLPPQRSGIANYSGKLLPALATYYDIELISDESVTVELLPHIGFPRRSVAWFMAHASEYERVIYQFGNSAFHEHMFEMLRNIPGVVVLHDFYLGHIQRHREFIDNTSGVWWRALYDAHGYDAMVERQKGFNSDLLVTKYPCNLRVIADADGVVVHSTYCRDLIEHWCGQRATDRVRYIPLLHETVVPAAKESARDRSKLPAGAFVVASFGFINSLKLIHRLLSAWQLAGFVQDRDCVLVLAGECSDPGYSSQLSEIISSFPADARPRVIKTGYLEQAQYEDMLAAVDVAVQLRTDSRGETSAAVLDCLAYGVPTIVNAHGAAAELSEDVVVKLEDRFSDNQLASALLMLKQDSSLCEKLGYAARACIENEHAPYHVASMYRDAIEAFVQSSPRQDLDKLAQFVATTTMDVDASDEQLADAARAMAALHPMPRYQRQWLVDVSELATTDAKSGIQRVVRSVLSRLLAKPPEGVRIEPVYCDGRGPYRYARRFTAQFLSLPVIPGVDAEVETSPGDIFLGLDLCPHIIPGMVDYFQSLREKGVQVQFVLYDILPALQPQWFPAKLVAHLQEWYTTIAQISDRVVTISNAVAEEYRDWLDRHRPMRRSPLMISSFHLGANIESSMPTSGMDAVTQDAIDALAGRQFFLMVGTVEPRKGHAQALDAFEELWARGSEAILVFVGKRGWRVEALVGRLESHPQLKKRVFWFEGVSDEVLEALYTQATMLLAASWGEGFGLPLIEAARRGLPVLARDLPVFREVAGSGALYFHADQASELADGVESALRLWRLHQLPNPREIQTMTWEESTTQLLDAMGGIRDCRAWHPDDRRLSSERDGSATEALIDTATKS